MVLTPQQQAENERINAQMLATQQAKRDARNAVRNDYATSQTQA